MIEKMSRLTALLPASDTSDFLEDLQDLGVVHLQGDSVDKDPAMSADFQNRETFLKVLDILKTAELPESYRNGGTAVVLPDHAQALLDAASTIKDRVLSCDAAIKELVNQLDGLSKEIAQVGPWGSFDPLLREALEGQGIHLRFFVVPRAKFEELPTNDLVVETIHHNKRELYLCAVLRDGESSDALNEFAVSPPQRNQAACLDAKGKLDQRLSIQNSALADLSGQLPLVEAAVALLDDRLAYAAAHGRVSPEADGEVIRLTGFVPASAMEALERFLDSRTVVSLLEEPEEADEVPVRLKNRRGARLFEPIARIFGLPDYMELDPTPFFAPFFALFFGLCLADLGYGIIVTFGSLVALVFLKSKGSRSIAALGAIFGVLTMIGGFVLDTAFGVKISDIPNLPGPVMELIFFKDMNDAMLFALMLGVVQLLVGFVMQMVNRVRYAGPLGIFQPLGTFLLIIGGAFFGLSGLGSDFAIGPIPVGSMIFSVVDPRSVGLIVVGVGLALILLFNSLDKKIWIRPLTGLWELYGIVSGVPGDILSYIRIFALSLAGGLLGGAINFIAGMIRGDEGGIGALIGMVVVLILGHAINFALAALGAFVHPLRLTFVEFYKAVGFNGGGKPYQPFKRRLATTGGMQ